MILDSYVIHRNRERHISTLKPYSQKLITIQCPMCGKAYKRRFHILANSGNFLCQQCTLRSKNQRWLKVGSKYNKLTVIRLSKKVGFSICQCDCGNITEIENWALKGDRVKSCGCLKKDSIKKVTRYYYGKEHWNWQGGITGKRQSLMAQSRYKEWREEVYKRDGYICQKCEKLGGILNAHHIEDYQGNKCKALNVNNGITFCEDCHKEFHRIYGRKNLTREMINEFCEEEDSFSLKYIKGELSCINTKL